MKKTSHIIFILGGGLEKNKEGHWQSSGFEGTVFGSKLRMLAGGYLFLNDRDSLIVASGGRGYLKKIKGAPSVAEVIKRELSGFGVPGKNIFEEKRSNNTYQQLLELKKIIGKGGFDRISIVSNTYHLGRVKALIELDKVLRKYLTTNKLGLIAAEKIVVKYDPKLKNKIKELYQSQQMKDAIVKEKNGIRQINNGTYDLKQDTSQPAQYII